MFPYSIFLVFQHSTDPKYSILLLAMMTKLDAYDDDINYCLFFRWTVYGAGKDHAVLNKRVECGGTELQGLCYGIPPPRGLQAGIENLILSIKHLNSYTSPQTAMCMHTHFLSQTTPKKRVGKLPILIGNYKGKISHLCRKNLVSTDGQHNTALKS